MAQYSEQIQFSKLQDGVPFIRLSYNTGSVFEVAMASACGAQQFVAEYKYKSK